MAKIKVITDSACDLPDELVHPLDIGVVSLSIRFGEEEFTDHDLTAKEFWAKCKASKVLPETAAPSPGAYQQAFQSAKDDGYDGIIVITLSAALSATHQAATLGADAFANAIPVSIVDSRAVSMAQGLITLEVAEAARSGKSLDELTALANNLVSRTGVVGTIDTLEHLIKGGRVSGAKALLGSMLSIKPLLELKDGLVTEAGRQRTRSKAIATCAATCAAEGPLRRLAIVHGDAIDVRLAEAALKDVTTEIPIIVADMGSVVGTHGGPGIIAICWIRAE